MIRYLGEIALNEPDAASELPECVGRDLECFGVPVDPDQLDPFIACRENRLGVPAHPYRSVDVFPFPTCHQKPHDLIDQDRRMYHLPSTSSGVPAASCRPAAYTASFPLSAFRYLKAFLQSEKTGVIFVLLTKAKILRR